MIIAILFLLLAFLLGSIPTGLWMARLRGVDIQKVGSGNIGFTNVWRSVGKLEAIITLIGDVGKGAAAAGILPMILDAIVGGGAAAGGSTTAIGADAATTSTLGAATAAAVEAGRTGSSSGWSFANLGGAGTAGLILGMVSIFGHCFSPFAGFRGGKGVATSLGVFVVLAPIPSLITFLIFVTLVGLTGYVSLGSLTGAAALPLLVFWRNGVGPLFWIAAIIGLLVIIRHRSNLHRLLTGTEKRFSWKGKAGKP